MPEQITVELPENVTKALAEVERLSAELAKLNKPDPDPSPDTLTTGLASAQAEHARVETELAKAHEELRKALEVRTAEMKATKAEVEKLHRQRRRELFIKRCEELDYLPGTQADDFAETLDLLEAGLRSVAPERAEKIFSRFNEKLTSWNTVIEKNNVLMQEIGATGGTLGMLSGAEAQIEALAQEKRAADPKLTMAKARTLVITENPGLYEKYRREQGGK